MDISCFRRQKLPASVMIYWRCAIALNRHRPQVLTFRMIASHIYERCRLNGIGTPAVWHTRTDNSKPYWLMYTRSLTLYFPSLSLSLSLSVAPFTALPPSPTPQGKLRPSTLASFERRVTRVPWHEGLGSSAENVGLRAPRCGANATAWCGHIQSPDTTRQALHRTRASCAHFVDILNIRMSAKREAHT